MENTDQQTTYVPAKITVHIGDELDIEVAEIVMEEGIPFVLDTSNPEQIRAKFQGVPSTIMADLLDRAVDDLRNGDFSEEDLDA